MLASGHNISLPPRNDRDYIKSTFGQDDFSRYVFANYWEVVKRTSKRYYNKPDRVHDQIESIVFARIGTSLSAIYDAYSRTGELDGYVQTIVINEYKRYFRETGKQPTEVPDWYFEELEDDSHEQEKSAQWAAQDAKVQWVEDNLHLFAQRQGDLLLLAFKEFRDNKTDTAPAIKSICNDMGITRGTFTGHISAIRKKIKRHV